MRRPIRMTIQALALGWYSFVATLGGISGLALAASSATLLPAWLGLALLCTGVLGLRGTLRMWRQRADTARAIIEFTAAGALIPLCVYFTFPAEQRGEAVMPALVGTALFVAVGLLVARSARRAYTGAA